MAASLSGTGRILAFALVSTLVAGALSAAEKKRALPRFVAARADKVNVRSGPGERYPVQWVLKRRNLPLQVVAEFDTWRKVRDWEGGTGWVHVRTLTGRRSVIVIGQVRTLRRRPAADAPAVAHAEPMLIGELLACRGDWCRVEISNFRGWLRHGEFWGAKRGEVFKK